MGCEGGKATVKLRVEGDCKIPKFARRFSVRHKQVKNAVKKIGLYPVQLLLNFKLKEDCCQRLVYMLFLTTLKLFLSFVSFKAMIRVIFLIAWEAGHETEVENPGASALNQNEVTELNNALRMVNVRYVTAPRGGKFVNRAGLPFEWNFRWIFLDKWNCTFSHQENETDWAVSFDSKFRMQVFSHTIKLKSTNHESKSKTQVPTAKA